MNSQDSYYKVPKCIKDYQILHQEDDFLLVEKPEFLLSIPGHGPENQDSLISRINATFPTAKPCHRLDLDTSGIMIIALSSYALMNINRQFEDKRVEKVYEAVVFGLVDHDHGTIDLPIAPDWDKRPRYKICTQQGKQAITRYQVVQRDPIHGMTRMRLYPLTGRSHQLRLHMREFGHPILGCDLYAHDAAYQLSPRLLLHACEIRFQHPTSGEQVVGLSTVPF